MLDVLSTAIFDMKKYLFLLLFFPFSSWSTSYFLAGVCYPDTPTVLSAFQSNYPELSNTTILNLTSSSISTSGLLTFVTQQRLYTTSAWTTNPSSTIQLTACTVSNYSTSDNNALASIQSSVAMTASSTTSHNDAVALSSQISKLIGNGSPLNSLIGTGANNCAASGVCGQSDAVMASLVTQDLIVLVVGIMLLFAGFRMSVSHRML